MHTVACAVHGRGVAACVVEMLHCKRAMRSLCGAHGVIGCGSALCQSVIILYSPWSFIWPFSSPRATLAMGVAASSSAGAPSEV